MLIKTCKWKLGKLRIQNLEHEFKPYNSKFYVWRTGKQKTNKQASNNCVKTYFHSGFAFKGNHHLTHINVKYISTYTNDNYMSFPKSQFTKSSVLF